MTDSDGRNHQQTSLKSSPLEVLVIFLRLGVTSFGGPIAHLGYFRTEFVERRRWFDDRGFSDLVSLCQFLPGPTSSEVGIAIGLARAGWLGSVAAWFGFTMPSALALIAFGYGISSYRSLVTSGAVHGLKLVAVAIVAQSVWGMAKNLCPDRQRAAIALAAALLTLVLPSSMGQIGAILVSGLLGHRFLVLPHLPQGHHQGYGVSRRVAIASWISLIVLLVGLPVVAAATGSALLQILASFYRAGTLVFGGGHVVLPLLQASLVPTGWVSDTDFLAGYGATQAVPGPLFTFSAFLGTVMHGPLNGWIGGLACLLALFLPSFLMVAGSLPYWEFLRQRAGIQAAMAGVNAGVVGILLSALYNPVWTSSVFTRTDFGLVLASFGLLLFGRVSPVTVVILAALSGWILTMV